MELLWTGNFHLHTPNILNTNEINDGQMDGPKTVLGNGVGRESFDWVRRGGTAGRDNKEHKQLQIYNNSYTMV